MRQWKSQIQASTGDTRAHKQHFNRIVRMHGGEQAAVSLMAYRGGAGTMSLRYSHWVKTVETTTWNQEPFDQLASNLLCYLAATAIKLCFNSKLDVLKQEAEEYLRTVQMLLFLPKKSFWKPYLTPLNIFATQILQVYYKQCDKKQLFPEKFNDDNTSLLNDIPQGREGDPPNARNPPLDARERVVKALHGACEMLKLYPLPEELNILAPDLDKSLPPVYSGHCCEIFSSVGNKTCGTPCETKSIFSKSSCRTALAGDITKLEKTPTPCVQLFRVPLYMNVVAFAKKNLANTHLQKLLDFSNKEGADAVIKAFFQHFNKGEVQQKEQNIVKHLLGAFVHPLFHPLKGKRRKSGSAKQRQRRKHMDPKTIVDMFNTLQASKDNSNLLNSIKKINTLAGYVGYTLLSEKPLKWAQSSQHHRMLAALAPVTVICAIANATEDVATAVMSSSPNKDALPTTVLKLATKAKFNKRSKI